jgi:hypothetical protein
MPVERNRPSGEFNHDLALPFELRLDDFRIAMQDVYDFFYDVNKLLVSRGLRRFDDMLRPAQMSGLISDMLTASIAKHSRTLTENNFHNGHPDLIVQGRYPNNAVAAGTDGVEIKSTRNRRASVDLHGAREQWMCVFVYRVDCSTEPAENREPMTFTDGYIAHVYVEQFRRNDRGMLGTRTASLNRAGIAHLRKNWLYRIKSKDH